MPKIQHGSSSASAVTPSGLVIYPVTLDRWEDLVALFGTSPVMSSCWCMHHRVRASEFSRFGTEARQRNREMMYGLITAGMIPGLLAYVDDRPAGWISVSPREDYVRLRHSPPLRAVDDEPVWSIVCFYTCREYRRQGITMALIEAAMRYAAAHGAATVEAYPVATWEGKVGPSDAYTGIASTFRALGFSEVGGSGHSRGQPRIVMRYSLRDLPPEVLVDPRDQDGE
jgi:GNAT superfamily N-acetyltransferase